MKVTERQRKKKSKRDNSIYHKKKSEGEEHLKAIFTFFSTQETHCKRHRWVEYLIIYCIICNKRLLVSGCTAHIM